MQNQSFHKYHYYYRPYNLPLSFPSVAFIGDNWVLPDTPVEDMHFHNCIEIGHCIQGNGTLYVEKKELNFKTNNISIISENTVHISKSGTNEHSNWEYIYFNPHIMFGNNFFPSNLISYPPYYSNVFDPNNNPHIHYLVSRIFIEYHEKRSNFKHSLKGLFLALMIAITRSTSIESEYIDGTGNFRSSLLYIDQNYTEKLQIKDIAKVCHLSESHFRRIFGEVMHMSPLDYINRLRIRKACQEISHGEKALNEIAVEVGFLTLSSFNRQFQNIFQCSPSDWRKKIKMSETSYEITSLEDDAAIDIIHL